MVQKRTMGFSFILFKTGSERGKFEVPNQGIVKATLRGHFWGLRFAVRFDLASPLAYVPVGPPKEDLAIFR